MSVNDAFAMLQLPTSASTQEVRKSYRVLSLRLHPDKARDVAPDVAASRFHDLHRAYELLSDPATLERLAKQAEEEANRKERAGKYESERRKMAEELEKRERDEGQRRREEVHRERKRQEDIQRLKEEGKRLRQEAAEAAMEQRRQAEQAAKQRNGDTPDATPELGLLDTTVRLLYPQELHERLNQSLEACLTSSIGSVVRLKATLPIRTDDQGKRKRSKEVQCLVTFELFEQALRLVERGTDFRLGDLVGQDDLRDDLDQIWVEWAAAKDAKAARKKRKQQRTSSNGIDATIAPLKEEEMLPGQKLGEPMRVTWWRKHERQRLAQVLEGGISTGTTTKPAAQGNGQAPNPSSSSYEADVLQRAMAAAAAKKAAQAQKQSSSTPDTS